MPFVEFDVDKTIEDMRANDSEFRKAWDESRTEYAVLGQLIKLRKEKGLSQSELAKRTGNKQQVISRIESRENSPTLKTLCSILDALEYDIVFVSRHSNT